MIDINNFEKLDLNVLVFLEYILCFSKVWLFVSRPRLKSVRSRKLEIWAKNVNMVFEK